MREPHAGEGCERRHRMGRKVCGSAAEAIGSRAWRLVALVTAALPLMGCGQASDDVLPAESFVLIEGGTFRMGDVFGDGEAHERPVHSVTVSDFYLSRYEVTVTEFRTFVEETDAFLDESGEPTDDVTKVKGFRLPTPPPWRGLRCEQGTDR
jgi:formylglycine-generating enzyme required for sulfatase activity